MQSSEPIHSLRRSAVFGKGQFVTNSFLNLFIVRRAARSISRAHSRYRPFIQRPGLTHTRVVSDHVDFGVEDQGEDLRLNVQGRLERQTRKIEGLVEAFET